MSALETLQVLGEKEESRKITIKKLVKQMVQEEAERLGDELIAKMKAGELPEADEEAMDAGYRSAYIAMCHQMYYECATEAFGSILMHMEESLENYRLPFDMKQLLDEAFADVTYLNRGDEEVYEDNSDLEDKIISSTLDYVLKTIESDEETAKKVKKKAPVFCTQAVNY